MQKFVLLAGATNCYSKPSPASRQVMRCFFCHFSSVHKSVHICSNSNTISVRKKKSNVFVIQSQGVFSERAFSCHCLLPPLDAGVIVPQTNATVPPQPFHFPNLQIYTNAPPYYSSVCRNTSIAIQVSLKCELLWKQCQVLVEQHQYYVYCHQTGSPNAFAQICTFIYCTVASNTVTPFNTI